MHRHLTSYREDAEIVSLFRSGATQKEIAARFAIPVGDVQDILRHSGVKNHEGGARILAHAKRRARAQAVGHSSISMSRVQLYSCFEDFDSLVQMKDAHDKFLAQKYRAAQRGIGWELSFSAWWGLWKASGAWSRRGRSDANSAVMARNGDVGPYSISNVHITSLSGNFREYWATSPRRVNFSCSGLKETTDA